MIDPRARVGDLAVGERFVTALTGRRREVGAFVQMGGVMVMWDNLLGTPGGIREVKFLHPDVVVARLWVGH